MQSGVMVKSRVPIQPFASVTLIVNAAAVVLVGVPETKPAAVSVKPAGNVPVETLYVTAPLLPLTVSCCE